MEAFAYALGGFIVSAILGGLGALEARKQLKEVKAQIPKPPTDETLAQDELALRDKIQRAVGVAVNNAEQRIKTLEKSDETKTKEIGDLNRKLTERDKEIGTLNGQVSRLEREHEDEETQRLTAEKRAHELDKENISLKTKLEIYPATLALIEQIITRPIQIILTLDGITLREIKTVSPLPQAGEGENNKEAKP